MFVSKRLGGTQEKERNLGIRQENEEFILINWLESRNGLKAAFIHANKP